MKNTPMLFWVISGKNVYQAFFMLFLAFSGISMATGTTTKQSSLFAALPWWGVMGFGVTLTLGAALNFASVYWRGKAETGIRMESVSAGILAVACFAFVAMALGSHRAMLDDQAPSTIGLCGLLGLASLGRWRQCKKAIKEIARFKFALAIAEATGDD